MSKTKATAAIVGPGNIGTDLMFKLMRRSTIIEPRFMVGVDPTSDGLARAKRLGLEASAEGVDWLLSQEELPDIVFEATSARAHQANAPRYAEAGILAVDLTPAAVGPYLCPPVNLSFNLDAPNVNMITCGGQATVPMVHAVSSVVPVPYAEIVASVSSRSAGPGTRANIDEFTETTAAAVEVIGGAEQGKAIIILNPVEPPLMMRNSVFCAIPEEAGEPGALQDRILESIHAMVRTVQEYVSGYHLRSDPQFDPARSTWRGQARVFIPIEVKGGGDYLPDYAGNLDIITAAAARVGDLLVAHRLGIATSWKSTSELGEQPADASAPERAGV
ncbi:acetaldehyde dehydrogenase (acetylating) [Micromonospora globispora]|uniref:acetaldehyde dehydrogenase (acetylating) n=1 Tax=Micromonospora globispora TaxID=1450148 RepID=UPI000D6EB694|nr:acetaldehyde dehydrogenase (acetylating) [Micromonospora globispora]PWU55423.1 acetaldehyde dehydrogenase (acetylating) [Micromonospora globispora]RQW91822.1 acetaldehyde dehydrogenase (acetylating) [Micromonospora globispora]